VLMESRSNWMNQPGNILITSFDPKILYRIE
jgi:hypothetical protein